MRRLIKILTVMSVICFTQLVAVADITLPASIKIRKPTLLTEKLIKESLIDKLVRSGRWGQDDVKQDALWEVYSDRAGNKTYMSPSAGSQVCGTLKFNQKVRIARIENNFALVYDDPKANGTICSNEAKSLGWVPMSNLLLWERCPVNEHKIYQRALLAANFDNVASDGDSKISVYASPERREKLNVNIYELKFYYVMKRDTKTGLVLLAHNYSLDGVSDKQLLGWVAPESYIAWNQRSCLEPNWEEDKVDLFRGKTYSIYEDPNLTKVVAPYVYGEVNPDEKKENSPYRYRMQAELLRFPILENDANKDALYKITTIASGRVINYAKDNARKIELKRKAEDFSNKLNNINLIFVIDGTVSMKPYFVSVKEAIKEGLKYFNAKKYKPRIGIVIYRDYADGNAMIESLPLVDEDDLRWHTFLDNVGNLGYGAKSSPTDKTYTEALYAGIDAGLDAQKMGYNKDQSNLMIVVGDCGNAPDDPKAPVKDDIIRKLADYNIQLMSHQVRRSSNNVAWQLFNTQMVDLIRTNIHEQYDRLNLSAPKFVKRDDGLGYDLENTNEETYFFGSIRRAPKQNAEIDPKALSKLIEHNFASFEIFVSNLQDILNRYINDGAGTNLTFEKSFLAGRGLTNKGIEDYNKSGQRGARTGYVRKCDPQGTPYWKPVVILSLDELENLIQDFAPAYSVARNINQADGNDRSHRKSYIDALKGIVKALTGNTNDDAINNMDLGQVSMMIHGLNESSASLKSYTLAQLAEPQIVSAEEYLGMLSEFKHKYDKLKRTLANKNYLYKFSQNGELTYYWIPIEDLP
ncbi:MAG: VWA domain-containing protein [Bacteroidales bacterium]|nr:VWA domain-containing protein [Bacteroidales bacterium]